MEMLTTSPLDTGVELDITSPWAYIPEWKEDPVEDVEVDALFDRLTEPEETGIEVEGGVTEDQAKAFAQEANKRAFPGSHMLLETANIVEERQSTYGPPEKHWGRTIDCINTQFSDYLKKPLPVWAWPMFMILDKASRRTTGEYMPDHPRDVAGYANGWSLVEESSPHEDEVL